MLSVARTAALGQVTIQSREQAPGVLNDTGKAEFAEQKGEAITRLAHGPGKHLESLRSNEGEGWQFKALQGTKLFLKAAAGTSL